MYERACVCVLPFKLLHWKNVEAEALLCLQKKREV
jgi:hypothetical protein